VRSGSDSSVCKYSMASDLMMSLSSGDADAEVRDWSVNETHSGGQMIQDSTMEPGTRRQEAQWSKKMMGMRSLTSLTGTSMRSRFAGLCGRALRSESVGTEMV